MAMNTYLFLIKIAVIMYDIKVGNRPPNGARGVGDIRLLRLRGDITPGWTNALSGIVPF
jgi:hypothetical protein